MLSLEDVVISVFRVRLETEEIRQKSKDGEEDVRDTHTYTHTHTRTHQASKLTGRAPRPVVN